MKRFMALVLAVSMMLALCACTKSESIIAAETAIEAIGEVTLESEEAIVAAEAAYEALTEEEKGKFKMYSVLTEAREKYDGLVGQQEIEKVEAMINEIGAVTLESGSKIDAANEAFDALSEDLQDQVSNKATLDAANEALDGLREAEKERIIAEMTPLFDVETDKVEGITWYQHKNMPNYIDIRSYIIPYIGCRSVGSWIGIRYNYTADDWIFWGNLTIMVDGKKYYKNVGSYNTTRDNDTEVWEYYDEILDVNAPMTDSDIQMLKAIAESEETIIRFQGDDYHYDLTVTSADKKMISDTLELYNALIW